MDRAGIKPYHKRKVQKMTPIHKENRVSLWEQSWGWKCLEKTD